MTLQSSLPPPDLQNSTSSEPPRNACGLQKDSVRFRKFPLITLSISLMLLFGLLSPIASHAQNKTPSWEYGPITNIGFGTGDRDQYKFLSIGGHAGKVLSPPMLSGLLRGQFEYAVEVLPLWQAYTPKFERANCYPGGQNNSQCSSLFPTGGTYTGVSVTPIILRWNLAAGHRFKPWVQGAGGLVWTNHKFPPVGPYPAPGHLGTSVFNFTPQFGIGFHYFIKPKRSISFGANAVHISSASLGDSNPGVNASVQFSIGYTWWK